MTGTSASRFVRRRSASRGCGRSATATRPPARTASDRAHSDYSCQCTHHSINCLVPHFFNPPCVGAVSSPVIFDPPTYRLSRVRFYSLECCAFQSSRVESLFFFQSCDVGFFFNPLVFKFLFEIFVLAIIKRCTYKALYFCQALKPVCFFPPCPCGL